MTTGAPYDRSVTSTRIRPRLRGRVRPGLLAPVVVVIVLGILGMHGIGAHGVNLRGPMAHAVDAAPSTGTVMAGHHTTAGGAATASNDVSTAGVATLSAPDQSHGQMGGMGGMVMLCVAMLGSAALALLTALVRGGRLPRVWAVLEPARRLRPVVSAVLRIGAGPPPAWKFSVIRC